MYVYIYIYIYVIICMYIYLKYTTNICITADPAIVHEVGNRIETNIISKSLEFFQQKHGIHL